MSMFAGTRLGPYEILAPLGAGGMGEVYRARDVKLNRDVAIKVLPEAVAADRERLARFEREAQVLAALNHPNIGHIYGFEDSTGTPALVMELVEGPTLADGIAQGPIPLAEALAIAKQIAEALEAAHDRGIIHRDLKPANIKVKDDGTAKVLDFGLAKAFDPAGSRTVSATISPTMSIHATQAGLILGTAAYMSPEQACGKQVDRRTDIWALGAVLYEMLTAKRAFGGEDASDTLAFVLTKEPDWLALPPQTPSAIRRLLRRCLEKDRARRLADIADARLEIDDAMRSGAALVEDAHHVTADRPASLRHLPWAIAAVAMLVTLGTIAYRSKPAAPPVPLRITVDLGVKISTNEPGDPVALSPSGDTLAFIGQGPSGPELYTRRLNQLASTRIEGTRGALEPFFSPDGQWIAYFTDRQLRKVPMNGGPSMIVSDQAGMRGGAWGEDGTIVFTYGGAAGSAVPAVGLYRVSASGGRPEPVTKPAGAELTHRWPQILSGGRVVLFTASDALGSYENARIVVQRLSDGQRKIVVSGGYHGRYAASGHLLYMHLGTLFAMPFDLDRLEAKGPAVPVVEGTKAHPRTAGADFTVSETGTLVYLSGEGAATSAPVVWLDRQGHAGSMRAVRVDWSNIQFAPDGNRVAFDVRGTRADIWTYELDRGTAAQVTFDAGDHTNPVWSPDGRFLAFAGTAGTTISNIFVQRSDGTGKPARLTASRTNPQMPSSWHPTGKFLAFTEVRPGTSQDVMILPLEPDSRAGWKAGEPYAFLAEPYDEREGAFSPDGRWFAYTSFESGTPEIYVRSFPESHGKWKISDGGGRFPVWSHSNRELLYQTDDGARLMMISYVADLDSFRASRPQVWGEGVFDRPNHERGFDLHPDGRRVAASAAGESEFGRNNVVFVTNFFEELRRLARPAAQ